jgi:hypothetical protein
MQRILSASLSHGRFYYYADSSIYYPSVTTVLSVVHKPAIVQWSRDIERRTIRTHLLQAVTTGNMPQSETDVFKLLENAQSEADIVCRKKEQRG